MCEPLGHGGVLREAAAAARSTDLTGRVVATAGAVLLERPGVNVREWAIQAVARQTCQTEIDANAFTGKGTLHALRHQVDMLASVELRMSELSAASKTGGLVDVYLMVHRRARTGYVFLRWREVGGAKRHLSWDAIEERARAWDSPTRQWLAQMTTQAQRLNDGHLRVRDELARIRHEVMARVQTVLPRSVA